MLAKFAAKQSRSALRGDAGKVDRARKPSRPIHLDGCDISRSELTEHLRMKLIDRFVSRELVVNVLFAIVVLSLVLVVGNIFRKLLPLLVNHDVPMEYLLTFIAYVLPFSLIFTIPWGLLTAILLVFGRLSADNELIALRSNGVSVTRVCIPLAAIAASGMQTRVTLRKNCGARFLIWLRAIRWRF